MQRYEVVAKRQLRLRILWLVLAVICGLAFALGVVDLLFLDDGAIWFRLARTAIGGAFCIGLGLARGTEQQVALSGRNQLSRP